VHFDLNQVMIIKSQELQRSFVLIKCLS